MDGLEKRLETLLDVILDETASDAQRREFAKLIEENQDLVTPLIEQLRTHSFLQWQCDEVKVREVHIPITELTGGSDRRERRVSERMMGRLVSVAAMLMVASGVIAGLWSWTRPVKQVAIAEVVDDRGVVWSDTTTALRDGRIIRPGRLDIDSGKLTLRFRSGATVSLNGAARTRIVSEMLVKLDRGQATAQVPHWAKGFTIETADVEVIDLGTQFGVMARSDGMTDVVIFEGQVDLKPTKGNRGVLKRLNQGEAARVSNNGSIGRIVEVRGDIRSGWSTIDHPLATRNVFKAIRDNIPPSDGSKYYYYQITTRGLVDDASAYVDRHPHEWNGLTARGLPRFLRDADYARTFNDYRYVTDFEIVVEIDSPANLYVFFDDRVPTPDWLLESFEDTGVDIGLDEGPWEGIPDHRTAVGGGNSIDNVFSVWRRHCERGELVTLGAVGQSSEARAMYGIAATPL